MKRTLFLILLLLMLAPPAAAQQNPITWTIVPGFDGTFKAGAWAPITITISNSGNDLRGQLAWRWNSGGTRFAQAIDLPRGSRKQVVLPVVADTFGGDATLEFLEGERVVASERVRYNQVDVSNLVVGVLSDTGDALPELAGLPNPIGSPTTLVRLEPATLPDRWELLQSLDVLFVHNTDTSIWSDEQRQAVMLWLADGGQLVVGGDRVTTAVGIGAMLPAQVDPATGDTALASLTATTGWSPRDAGATVRTLRLLPEADAEVIVTTDAGLPMIVRREHGSGLVLQTAFDLAALSAQGNPVSLWESLLPRSGALPQWQQFRSNGEWVLRESLALPALRLPSVWLLLAFLGVYVVFVGPVNYLALRRLDRREWAYLTIPVTVAMFALGAYAFGALGRGGATTVNSLTFVRTASGSNIGQSLSYLGVFSPGRREYEVGLDAETLVSNVFSSFDSRSDTLRVVRGEAAVEVPSFLVDVGALRPLLAERALPAPPVVVTLIEDGAQGRRLEIENRSTERLTDAAILADSDVQKIDDLEPGERRTVELEPGNFGGEELFQTGGVIRRSAAVNTLRNSFFVPQMEPAPGGAAQVQARQVVMLVALSSEPQIRLTLNGAPADVQGETLYLWPAAEARP